MIMAKDSSAPLVIITGAARRIGREIALLLAKSGFSIGIHYHLSVDDAVQTSQEITKLGGQAILFKADLRDPAQITTLFQQVQKLPMKLIGLINSAAVMPVSRLDTSPVELWDEIFNINVRSAWLCSQHAARIILPGEGWIINLTDAGASNAWTEHAIYNLSKYALQHLTRLQARTFAPQIRVNAIAPGLILQHPETSDLAWNRLQQRLPLSASGTPEEIARAVLFLVNQPAITGQTIVVDGGYQLL